MNIEYAFKGTNRFTPSNDNVEPARRVFKMLRGCGHDFETSYKAIKSVFHPVKFILVKGD